MSDKKQHTVSFILQSHFIEILDMMHGSARSMVNMHILIMATRYAP